MKLRSLTLFLALIALAASLIVLAPTAGVRAASPDPPQPGPQANDVRLAKAYRFEQGGWTYVHLEGSPATIGFQHGYLLASEIADAVRVSQVIDPQDAGRDWRFFRRAAHDMLWPKIDREYQQELQGIVDGLKAHGVNNIDLDDVVALNAMEELADYYVPWLNKQNPAGAAGRPQPKAPGNCSAFVATGSYTHDGKVIIAHNNWTTFVRGARWVMVFDLVPARGHRILMDGYPGLIISDDDFGINDAGIMVTETTITQFEGWDPKGKAEFVRARKALQYGASIDDYVRIMLEGNNGGYANDWLLADRKTGEVARFENGLKHHKVWRTKDGYFVGSNFASDPELLRDEAPQFNSGDASTSPNARHVRWEQLMAENKGKIDVAAAQRFLSDHYDSFAKKEEANERTLCGHVETSPRGIPQWNWPAFFDGGAVQGKAADANMAANMSFVAHTGHPCGADFKADSWFAEHGAANAWQKPVLKDMPSGPWTTFKAGQREPQ